MTFKDLLYEDMNRVGCTLSELSRASGLSAAVLSRYRSGEREPRLGSRQLSELLKGLDSLEKEAGLSDRSEQRHKNYEQSLVTKRLLLSSHLSKMLEIVPVSIKELSIALNYDASYLSRIRSGKRNPQDPELFARNLSQFITRIADTAQIDKLMALCGCTDESSLVNDLSVWLVEKDQTHSSSMDHFLKNLDNFDLNEFIASIKFTDQDLLSRDGPPAPSGTYYGLERMRQAELDFFRNVLISDSDAPVFMCNTMPIEKMTEDPVFIRRWISLIAACLQKGIHFNVVHDVGRPFEEMMVGLESWIPLYMTGQITPWYLPGTERSIFRQSLYVSGAAVLRGECMISHSDHGMYELHTEEEWIRYGKTRAQDILISARPLMKIFTSENREEFLDYMYPTVPLSGNRFIHSASLPICSLTRDILVPYLQENGLPEKTISEIENYRRRELLNIHNILKKNSVIFEIPEYTEEQFEEQPPSLFLSPLMRQLRIPYTKELYQKHLQLTMEFAETNPGLTLIINPDFSFRNLAIHGQEDYHAVVIKNRSPEICFVITHPNMVQALNHYTAPIIQ
ncbi:MAG: helix-turn-helix transcriptional regulator [Solobacterium sp.]|nr:helix-turn-helix transcriptional regulator [Solobacterium sp.]